MSEHSSFSCEKADCYAWPQVQAEFLSSKARIGAVTSETWGKKRPMGGVVHEAQQMTDPCDIFGCMHGLDRRNFVWVWRDALSADHDAKELDAGSGERALLPVERDSCLC